MTDDPFDDADSELDSGPQLGPIFPAAYDSEDECCGQGLHAGQVIRANGEGGFIHASFECEELYRS